MLASLGSIRLWDTGMSARAVDSEISPAEQKKSPAKKRKKKKKANAYLSPKETHAAQEAGFGGTEWKCGEFAIYTNYHSIFSKLVT